MSDFVHLHLHTTYSLLDGQCQIKPLVAKAKSMGMNALAVTDHGNLYALKAFYDECRKQGIKPILGCEAYVTSLGDHTLRHAYFQEHKEVKEKRFHLCLHAKNLVGYHNLVRLVSEAFVNGYYYNPRIDHALLEKYHEGLHCSSACIAGEIAYYLDEGTGGPGIIKFNCGLNTRRDFYYVAWRYFASYPEVDSLALYEYTQKEFSELKGSLPKVSYKEWPDGKIAMFFVNRIVYLYQLEQQFIQAKSEGYDAIVVAKFYALKNAKAEPEKVFYTDGTDEMLKQVIAIIEKTNRNYVISQYSSEKDFIIG